LNNVSVAGSFLNALTRIVDSDESGYGLQRNLQ